MKAKRYVNVGGRPLVLTHLDKIFYPQSGYTKGDVIRYYREISPWVLPHLRNRLFTLKRFPNGVEADSFYQKQVPFERPKWIETCRYEGIDYVLVNDLPTLLWVANLGAIELHTTLATKKNLDSPLQVVFDLDPGEGASLSSCAKTALVLRDYLWESKLQSFPKTSGSKGIHVCVPLNVPTSYQVTTRFAKMVAESLERMAPDRMTSRMTKKERVGKVFIDWSQNVVFKTTACVYSLRAVARPQVSCPLDWREVERFVLRGATSLSFDVEEVLKRIRKYGDLFLKVLTLEQALSIERRAA